MCGHFRGRFGLGYVEGCWAWLFRALVRLWPHRKILCGAVLGSGLGLATLGCLMRGRTRVRFRFGFIGVFPVLLFRALVRLWLRWDILSVAVRGCAMPLAALGFPVRGHFGMRLGYGYAGEILCRAISGCAPVLDTLRGTGAWLFREAACGWPRWSALCVAISGCVPVWPRWGLLS